MLGSPPLGSRDIIFMPDVEWVRRLCLSLPDATEDMPWEDTLCFKVRGKIFTMVALADGRFPSITLKCAPEAFNELLEIEGISPARYVGRYKWATLASSNVLPASELERPDLPVLQLGGRQSAKEESHAEEVSRQTRQEVNIVVVRLPGLTPCEPLS